MESSIRTELALEGILQGVGFRPTLARLAQGAGLGGSVRNEAGAVRVELIGKASEIERFLEALPGLLPRQARLDRMSVVSRATTDRPATEFVIATSATAGALEISIPADLVVCDECLQDLSDPTGRFFGYPFTTCTNCGPRYTVVDGLPYDRERTALAGFPLCDECRRDYEDPDCRRFHAETIACPTCGPRLRLLGPDGRDAPGTNPKTDQATLLRAARAALAAGHVVAVQGIGGFALAVNAHDPSAVRRLRRLKQRPHRPLAVMAADLGEVERVCEVSPKARTALRDPAGPIVVLPRRPGTSLDLLSPDTRTLGVMLPTSPLHWLLHHPLPGDPVPRFSLLVMTSGNHRGEPICLSPEEATRRLGDVADLLLVHDRPIRLRNDDSLVALMGGQTRVWRRARGFAPRDLRVPPRQGRVEAPVTLALGAHLKCTVALGWNDRIVVSPHVGDLDTPEAIDGLEKVVEAFPRFFDKRPETIAVDLHPDLASSRLGRRLADEWNVPLIEVQHHHAHAAAALAEAGWQEALALVFDGTGLGPDGTLWGGELLYVDPSGYRRLGTYAPCPLPGGDAAVQQPARQLVARRALAGLPVDEAWCSRYGLRLDHADLWQRMARSNLNAPLSHSVGRLFDAYATALGLVPEAITYEGQAAIRLEARARQAKSAAFVPYDLRDEDGLLVVDFSAAFEDLEPGPPREESVTGLALGFHESVRESAEHLARFGRAAADCSRIVLSGGVMMNQLIVEGLLRRLGASGFEVFAPALYPPGDGGVSLGQVQVVRGGA